MGEATENHRKRFDIRSSIPGSGISATFSDPTWVGLLLGVMESTAGYRPDVRYGVRTDSKEACGILWISLAPVEVKDGFL